jgi:F-type H+-transporting ATPase subunit b
MDMFKLNPGLAIWTWITFGILFFVLSKFVFPRLLKSIRDREDTIARSVDNAARIEGRLAELEGEHASVLKRAREEADEVLRRTRTEAEDVRRKLLDKAEQEAKAVLERIQQEIAEERVIAVDAIRREVAELVMEVSEKLVGKSMNQSEDLAWTRKQVETL